MRYTLIFLFSFIVAFTLDIIPLPVDITWFRPAWVLLVVCAWIMAAPNSYNITTAFFAGIILDLLNGSMLGEHALAMVIVAYWITKLHRLIAFGSYFQQMFFLGFLVFIYKLIIYCLQYLIHQPPENIFYWGSVIVSAILWPWISAILTDLSQHHTARR